jgi:hypothetical protein
MTKKKVAKKVTPKQPKVKVTPKQPKVADSVRVAPPQLGFFEKIWKWLKDRIK